MSKSPKVKKRQPDEPSQIDKFKQAAREIGTNNDPKAFDERVRKIVKPKS